MGMVKQSTFLWLLWLIKQFNQSANLSRTPAICQICARYWGMRRAEHDPSLQAATAQEEMGVSTWTLKWCCENHANGTLGSREERHMALCYGGREMPCVMVARKCLFERGTSELTPKGEENSLRVSERGKRKREEPMLSPRSVRN